MNLIGKDLIANNLNMEELKQLIQIQIENCKKFAGSTNNDYYEGAKDAYELILANIKRIENNNG